MAESEYDVRMDFSGQRVLITGAAGGIGSAMAAAFAEHGAALVLADRDQAALDALANRLGADDTLVFDQANAAEADALAARAGPVQILMNNAGILHTGPLLWKSRNRSPSLAIRSRAGVSTQPSYGLTSP